MRRLISPWLLAAVAVWVALMVGVTVVGIEVFTNVQSGPAPGAPPFVHWDRLLVVAALIATAGVGLLLGVRGLVRRR